MAIANMNAETPQPEAPSTFVADVRAHGVRASVFGPAAGCTDHVVGDILSSWRYDLSALSPEVRGAYLEHLSECPYCRARQRLHRTVDLALLSLFTMSALVFLVVTMILHREPWGPVTFAQVHMHRLSLVLTLQSIAVGGLLVSVLMWVLVAIATPAPELITQTVQQRRLQARERVI